MMDDDRLFEFANRMLDEQVRTSVNDTVKDSNVWKYATIGWFVGFITGYLLGD